MSANNNSNKKDFEMHQSFATLVDRYDGFILDQFGVMHNGSHGLDGAPACVRHLHKDQHKKLVILSNTSSSSQATLAKLPKLGFDSNHFVTAVTSGEEASRFVKQAYQGKKALWMTWKSPKHPSPMDFIQQCQVDVTNDFEEADLMICHGSEVLRGPGPDGVAEEESLGSFFTTGNFDRVDPFLEKAKQRNIPMVCANPDYIMVHADGSHGHMPGKLAERYQQHHGATADRVISFGKPHVAHFQACLRELNLPSDRVAHVGDSLCHDVAGANETGIDSIFVVGGIHREELGCDLGTLPPREKLVELFEKHGQTPTHVVHMLKL